jgi:small subunit ribosomal protein S16
MQRTGRKGHAQFRMIVQDSRRTPTSGNIVELLGSYDPHTKVATINKDRAAFFLANGAQPSDRALRILGFQKVEIPKWVEKTIAKKSVTKNPLKLRKNQPKVEEVVVPEVKEEVEVPAEPETKEENLETPKTEETVVAEEVPEAETIEKKTE